MEEILGPMLASQTCLPAFWVLTYIVPTSFILVENVFFLLFFNYYVLD